MQQVNYIAYYRVSTKRQGKTGLGLEAQKESVQRYLGSKSLEVAKEYVEVESGKHSNRPQLQNALRACKRLPGVLVIAKLDRLARNVAFISRLMESGVDFVAVDLPEANKLTIHIMAAMAEYERDLISKRTKEALAAAKARGVKLGGPNILDIGHLGRRTQVISANAFAESTVPLIRQLQADGVNTLQEIADCLNRRGIPTSRGGKWHPNTVKRVLTRC